MRFWYLRRSVPWATLVGCLLMAIAVTLMVRRWPEVSTVGVPIVVAACAAAAGFVYDEPAAAIAAVTPRGGWWRGSVRLLAVVVPLVAVLLLISAMPAELGLDRNGWWLLGAAFVLLAVAPSAAAARHQVGRPGGAVAGAMVLLGLAPVLLTMLLGWDPVYPFGDFPDWVWAFWSTAALMGAAGCVFALVSFGQVRPGWGTSMARRARA